MNCNHTGVSVLAQAQQFIPLGFICDMTGVYEIVKKKQVKIALKPIVVTLFSRNISHEKWKIHMTYYDIDNVEHNTAFPKELLHSNTNNLINILVNNGFPIVKGQEETVVRFLSLFMVMARCYTSSKTGWIKNIFILPAETINEPTGHKIVYLPEDGAPISSSAIEKSGTFYDWQNGMRNASKMLVFYVCAALSAPVRFKVGIESGGFHIYNLTSHGKTTVLQAAASMWGNGVDPAIGGGNGAYITRWNSTTNALEVTAESFNDLPMIIDEIGEGDANALGKTIYKIFSGTGRNRAKSNGALQEAKSWRGSMLSAGEVPISDFIASGGKPIKGGQAVRLVDIDLSLMDPLFANAAEANAMKKLCAEHYGWAGPEFLQRVPDLAQGWDTFDKNRIGPASTPIESRVRERFALVAYTGALASWMSILPWTEDHILESVRAAYSAWLSKVETISDIDRTIDEIKSYLLKNKARFERKGTSVDFALPNRVGWYRDDRYHFIPNEFKKVCNGTDATQVKKQLKILGLLYIGYCAHSCVNTR